MLARATGALAGSARCIGRERGESDTSVVSPSPPALAPQQLSRPSAGHFQRYEYCEYDGLVLVVMLCLISRNVSVSISLSMFLVLFCLCAMD